MGALAPSREPRFGVELEFWQPDTEMWADKLCEQLVPHGWRVDELDTEVASPIYSDLGEAHTDIAFACDVLRGLGCRVSDPRFDSRLRGLHVHLSRTDLGIAGCRRLMARYMEELPRLNDMWPDRYRSMPGSSSCGIRRAAKARTIRELVGSRCESCRPAIGPHHAQLRTIEARQHPATLDPSEIMAWVECLIGWAQPRSRAS